MTSVYPYTYTSEGHGPWWGIRCSRHFYERMVRELADTQTTRCFVYLTNDRGDTLAIAVEGPTLFARLLAGSVTLSFFIYAFVNMGMVSGMLPVVGVPLPFISYGGTAMVTLGLGLGILMSVAKAKQLVQS